MLISFNSIKMWDFSETRVTDGPTLAQICENAPEKACWLRNEIYDILLSKPEGKSLSLNLGTDVDDKAVMS